ncbi:hypothetical protein C8F04DRAFT_1135206 [Mycena alexandri]|uniref:Uncharacterized protein n=1 Tax=Mycena alexandri TaxID=1745969 RepID=A0AAD6WSA7_9AGAR|nr:hypothetical protein C8F04DRAFT_1135206 [Mycena alexandri]
MAFVAEWPLSPHVGTQNGFAPHQSAGPSTASRRQRNDTLPRTTRLDLQESLWSRWMWPCLRVRGDKPIPATCHPSCDACSALFATQVIQDRKYNEAPQPIQRPSCDESDTEDDVSVDSVSSWGGQKKKARTSKPRSAVNLSFTTIALEAPTLKKKGARTEAQRRAHLEGDAWTTKVAPHYVGCRGCKQIIRLDRRSRYYPGLWEKHRERCNGVKIGLVEVRTFTRPSHWTGFLTHYGWHRRIIPTSPRKSKSRLLSKRVHRSIRWSWPRANPVRRRKMAPSSECLLTAYQTTAHIKVSCHVPIVWFSEPAGALCSLPCIRPNLYPSSFVSAGSDNSYRAFRIRSPATASSTEMRTS